MRCWFNPWVGKIPWRKAWQPTPVFLPGENPMDKRAWPAMVYRAAKSRTWLKWLSTHAYIYLNVYLMWSCLKMAWKLKCSRVTTHWSLQAPCAAPGSSSWDMTFCLQLLASWAPLPQREQRSHNSFPNLPRGDQWERREVTSFLPEHSSFNLNLVWRDEET